MSLGPHIFVTDGSYPNSLAIIRSLGHGGAKVTVGERDTISRLATVGFWSRYCRHKFRYPNPNENTQTTVAALQRLFSQVQFDAAIPVGLQMVELFVLNAEKFRVPVMLPPRESFEIAADKQRTFQFAIELGLRVPQTVSAHEYRTLQPPYVFKHPRTGVFIAASADEAELIVARLGAESSFYIVQEFVPGQNGFGYFGFFVEGQERGFFMHERLMQYPIEGGPSVEARSVYDPELRDAGSRLLTALRWHGVAMVEFKRSERDGKLYLMEINPKFWGSLDLAIQAGSNFPIWVQDYILGRNPRIPGDYKRNLIYQWVVPSGLKSFLRYPAYRWQFIRHLINPAVRKDVRLLDPLPSLAGLAATARNLHQS